MVNFKNLRQMIEVKGNGNIVSKEIQVGSFIRLHLQARGVIELVQSNEEKVIIETDENLQDYFQAMNSGRTLYVTSEAKFRKPIFTHCKITVYLRQMDTLDVRCDNGDLICPEPITLMGQLEVKIQSVGKTEINVNVPVLKVLSQCVGDLVLKGKCGAVDIKNQGVGNLTANELFAEELSIKNMAVGNVELRANDLLTIAHYGVGYVHYYGNAVLKDVKQHGAGLIKHMEEK